MIWQLWCMVLHMEQVGISYIRHENVFSCLLSTIQHHLLNWHYYPLSSDQPIRIILSSCVQASLRISMILTCPYMKLLSSWLVINKLWQTLIKTLQISQRIYHVIHKISRVGHKYPVIRSKSNHNSVTCVIRFMRVVWCEIFFTEIQLFDLNFLLLLSVKIIWKLPSSISIMLELKPPPPTLFSNQWMCMGFTWHSGMWLTADQKSAFTRMVYVKKACLKIWKAKKCMNSIEKVATRPSRGVQTFVLHFKMFRTDA